MCENCHQHLRCPCGATYSLNLSARFPLVTHCPVCGRSSRYLLNMKEEHYEPSTMARTLHTATTPGRSDARGHAARAEEAEAQAEATPEAGVLMSRVIVDEMDGAFDPRVVWRKDDDGNFDIELSDHVAVVRGRLGARQIVLREPKAHRADKRMVGRAPGSRALDSVGPADMKAHESIQAVDWAILDEICQRESKKRERLRAWREESMRRYVLWKRDGGKMLRRCRKRAKTMDRKAYYALAAGRLNLTSVQTRYLVEVLRGLAEHVRDDVYGQRALEAINAFADALMDRARLVDLAGELGEEHRLALLREEFGFCLHEDSRLGAVKGADVRTYLVKVASTAVGSETPTLLVQAPDEITAMQLAAYRHEVATGARVFAVAVREFQHATSCPAR